MEEADRELMRKAAKAAGVSIHGDAFEGASMATWCGFMVDVDRSRGVQWNPLEDDGDALRLMVKLHIEVSVDAFDARVSSVPAFVPGFGGIHEDARANPLAATRRAIVRAAAIIGSARG